MAHSQLLVIVARQRSGTTALAETLQAGGPVHSFGEVFHDLRHGETARFDLRLHPEAYFFDFRTDIFHKKPELSYPSAENQAFIFDQYISHLSNLAQKKWILLDIKYNSWHHFEHVYSISGQAPFLLYLLRRKNAAFAHVTRRSAFARYCSEKLALARGKWHVEREKSVEAADAIIIDPAAALRDMQETHREIDLFNRFLGPIPRRIEVRYEELFSEGHLTQEANLKVKRLLDGEWNEGVQVPLQKMTPPLRDVVKNRHEVLTYFEATTFAQEVAAALDV
jgi:hypothetical protein